MTTDACIEITPRASPARIARASVSSKHMNGVLWWFGHGITRDTGVVAEAAAIAALPRAQRTASDIHIRAPVAASFLWNLGELARFRNHTDPQHNAAIRVTAAELDHGPWDVHERGAVIGVPRPERVGRILEAVGRHRDERSRTDVRMVTMSGGHTRPHRQPQRILQGARRISTSRLTTNCSTLVNVQGAHDDAYSLAAALRLFSDVADVGLLPVRGSYANAAGSPAQWVHLLGDVRFPIRPLWLDVAESDSTSKATV